jgi:AcrR family transcriptional regulator
MPDRDTRQDIIAAAVTILGRDGPDRFSASTLAAEAGISKATVFHHFRSLDEVPLAALDHLSEQALRPDLPETPTLAQILQAIGRAAFGLAADQRPFLRAYFAFASKAMFDMALRQRLQVSLAAAQGHIAALLAPAIPDPRRADTWAGAILAQLDGITLHMMLHEDDSQAARQWAAFSAALEHEVNDAHRD